MARSVSGVNANPSSGTGYSPNSIYGSGSNLTNGNFVVYTGTGNSLSVTGLNSSTAYFFNIYTYTNTGTCYNTTGILTGTGVTLAAVCSTPDNPTGVSASAGNTQSIVTWTNGSCNDEMIIVAHTSSIGGTPTGTYTSNSRSFADVFNPNFPSGGKVVYNGSSSPQTITNLTNGTLYYFKLFTRKGSNWSSGVETTATPATVTSSSDYFRSRQTGDWSAISTWESSIDNSAWINATLVPSSTANNIVIQSGDIVTISGVTNLDQTTVLGSLVWNSSTNVITIADGSGDDLTIATGGVLEMAGTDIPTIIFTGTLLVNRNGILRYTSGAGSGVSTILAGTSSNTKIVYLNGGIFDWNSISTYNSSSITYFATSNINDIPIFRNSQTPGSPVGAGTATVFNGIYEANSNIIFQNNGTKTFRNGIIGTGNVTQASGCGQFIISGSTATIGGTGILNIHTNGIVANSGTAVTLSSSKTITGNASSNTFTVNGSIDCSTFVVSGSSTFALANNATLITANANGVTGFSASTGSIQMSSSSNELFDDEANYIFNGIGTQSTGFAGTSTQVNGTRNIVISNTTGIVTLDSDVQAPGLTGVLSVTSGSIFSLPNARNINKSGSGVVSIAGTIQAEDANGFSDGSSSNFQGFSNSDIILGANSVIEYNGGTQTVTNQVPYQNILFSSSSAKTPAGNISVFRNVSITGAGPLTLGNNIFTFGGDWYSTNQVNLSEGTSIVNWDGSGIQNLTVTGGENFYLLSISGSGTLNLNSAVSVGSGSNGGLAISSGTLDAGTNTLNSSAANMTMTGGLLRLAKTGTTLPELSGTYSNTAGTIELYGNGSQTLRGSRDYATLLFTANTVASVTSAPNSFTGIGIAGNAILDIQSFDVGGNFRTLTMTGSSLLRTSGSGTVPPMGDLYTLSPNTTIEIYGTNASTSIRQGPTTGGSNPHRYQNLIFSGVTTITAPANVLRVEGNITNNLSTGIFNNNSGTVSLTGTNQTISGTAIADFYNLNLDANTIANLASSQRLINTISLSNGAVFNANGNLTLVSNNLGTARIGRILTGAVVNGNVILQRYLPGKATSPNMIYQITSPLVGNAITNWQGSSSLTGIYITGNFIGKSVSTVTGVFNTAGSSLFRYNASNGTFLATPSVGGVNTDLLSVGTGYRAFVRDGTASYGFGSVVAKTISSVGTITSGTIPFNIIYNNALTNTGWNLLGNPYPSEISGDLQDANAWPTRTNVNGAIYIWNSTAAGYNTYIDGVGVLAGTGAWNGVIPSSQAFWVRSTATGASLSVAEFAKVSTTTGAIWRTESQSILRIALLSGNDANETIIRFKPDATPNFDGNFDAEKLDAQAGGASVSIASYSNNKDKRLSINSLPPIIKAGSDTVFLDVSMPLGSNSLHFSQSETIDNATNIFLLDQFDNQLIDLKLNAQYDFSVTTIVGSKDRNRFALVFSNAAYLNADSIIVLSDSVGSNGVLQLESNADWIAKSSTDWFEITSQNANAISIKALIANNSKALKIGIITLSGNGLIDRYIAVNQKFKLTDSSSTNTNDEISDFKFEVHPNPLHKLQDLTVSSSASIHPATIQIYDGIGKLVYHKLIKTDLSQTFTIQLPSTISSGVFLIVYGSPMRILNKKLIITD